jgi:hypothetical protein
MLSLHASFVFLMCGSVLAQTVTIPALAATRDGTGIVDTFGLERSGRAQILIGAQSLVGTVGRNLTTLRLRRDGARFDLLGGVFQLTLKMSASSALDASAPSARFADNHRVTEVIVFQGEVIAPTSGRLANRNAATWTTADTIDIPFTTPFAYDGGTLCIQLDVMPGSGVLPRWWPLDSERQAGGIATPRGATCGTLAAQARVPAAVDARSLRVGNTLTFTTLGQPASIAVFMLSAQLIGPLDLSFLGAPGCFLHVLPDVSLTTSVGAPVVGARPGAAAVSLRMPNEAQFVGAQMYGQWLLVHNLTLATTNAIDVQIAQSANALDGSIVAAAVNAGPLPEVGHVELAMPVLQIDHRAR